MKDCCVRLLICSNTLTRTGALPIASLLLWWEEKVLTLHIHQIITLSRQDFTIYWNPVNLISGQGIGYRWKARSREKSKWWWPIVPVTTSGRTLLTGGQAEADQRIALSIRKSIKNQNRGNTWRKWRILKPGSHISFGHDPNTMSWPNKPVQLRIGVSSFRETKRDWWKLICMTQWQLAISKNYFFSDY